MAFLWLCFDRSFSFFLFFFFFSSLFEELISLHRAEAQLSGKHILLALWVKAEQVGSQLPCGPGYGVQHG